MSVVLRVSNVHIKVFFMFDVLKWAVVLDGFLNISGFQLFGGGGGAVFPNPCK